MSIILTVDYKKTNVPDTVFFFSFSLSLQPTTINDNDNIFGINDDENGVLYCKTNDEITNAIVFSFFYT